MSQNYYIIKAAILAIVTGLLINQLQLVFKVIEAKNYKQPYGDIMEEEDENSYETANKPNRYGMRNSQYAANRGKYQNEFQPETMVHKRGEREKLTYNENVEHTPYVGGNRHLGRNNPNGWISSASTLEDQQTSNLTMAMGNEGLHHKCNVLVPMDALHKYPDAKKTQDNKITGSVYIEICCKGYATMRWRGKTLCRPVCDNCQNGRCVAPGVCECYDEFVANDNGDCVFTCPLGCLNGRCFLDGSCQCDPGYKLDESRKFCRPICSKGCGLNRLHNCTEPEICGCIKDFVLTDNDCQPVCQPDCGIGGICRKPNVCECNHPYNLKDGVCQSDCYQKCDNGICYSRNRCICNPGYTYHERSTQCIPK